MQAEICGLPHSINIPFDEIAENANLIRERADDIGQSTSGYTAPIILYCRRGVYSAHAARTLVGQGLMNSTQVMSLSGGLTEWKRTINPDFPMY